MGDGNINTETLSAIWTEEVHYFTMSFAAWGEEEKWRKSGYYQVTRPERNLVLQVNFGHEHDSVFYPTIGKENRDCFTMSCHPISKNRNTMGWVRMDIDYETNEVLIEEIQNDWLRELIDYKEKAQQLENGIFKGSWTLAKDITTQKVFDYYLVVKKLIKIWDEVLLHAALLFIQNEFKMNTVWYHTFESGNRCKELRNAHFQPPKSIYTKLSKKFCFTETNQIPQLVKACKYLKKYLRKPSKWNQIIL